MIFFIFLQILLNLHSTIVGNNAQPEALLDQDQSPNNDYWYSSRYIFDQSLQLPAAVYPVILDYFPLVPAGIRDSISLILEKCKTKNVSKSDFNKVQTKLIKGLVEWKYYHNIEDLRKEVAEAKNMQEKMKSISADSSDKANYLTLYDKFFAPIPGLERPDLDPPARLQTLTDLRHAVRKLPIWCCLKASVLLHIIDHIPEHWRIFANRRLATVVETYYDNKRKIENKAVMYEMKCDCLRESEELIANELAVEVLAYTSMFERSDVPWFGDADFDPRFTYYLQLFAYADILVPAQGLPEPVLEQVAALYECFAEKRTDNPDRITNFQKILVPVLHDYPNQWDTTVIEEVITNLLFDCSQLEGSLPVTPSKKGFKVRRRKVKIQFPKSSSSGERKTGKNLSSKNLSSKNLSSKSSFKDKGETSESIPDSGEGGNRGHVQGSNVFTQTTIGPHGERITKTVVTGDGPVTMLSGYIGEGSVMMSAESRPGYNNFSPIIEGSTNTSLNFIGITGNGKCDVDLTNTFVQRFGPVNDDVDEMSE